MRRRPKINAPKPATTMTIWLGNRNLVLMPARNDTAAKITVRRTYASPRSLAAVAFSKFAAASAFNRFASSPATQAVLRHRERRGRRRRIRARLRRQPRVHRALHLGPESPIDERLFVGSSGCDRTYILQKHADVNDFKGIETAGINGGGYPLGRRFVVLPRLEGGPSGRLVPAPRRQHRGGRDENYRSEVDPNIELRLLLSDGHGRGFRCRLPIRPSSQCVSGRMHDCPETIALHNESHRSWFDHVRVPVRCSAVRHASSSRFAGASYER